jgi:hypothetical protein
MCEILQDPEAGDGDDSVGFFDVAEPVSLPLLVLDSADEFLPPKVRI